MSNVVIIHLSFCVWETVFRFLLLRCTYRLLQIWWNCAPLLYTFVLQKSSTCFVNMKSVPFNTWHLYMPWWTWRRFRLYPLYSIYKKKSKDKNMSDTLNMSFPVNIKYLYYTNVFDPSVLCLDKWILLHMNIDDDANQFCTSCCFVIVLSCFEDVESIVLQYEKE